MSGKYPDDRAAALHFLCGAGWSTESFGDVTDNGVVVWRISNKPADVHRENTEINSVLEDHFAAGYADSKHLRQQLVGHFLVVEDDQGFVGVAKYPTEQELVRRFNLWEQKEMA